MNFEAGKIAEDEKKKKEKSEKEKKQESLKIEKQEKIKKEAREKKESDEILHKLEDMLEEWNLSEKDLNTIKQIVENADITEEEVEEILEKIEEIEKTQDVDSYLPAEFRITSEDYKQSLTDDIKRIQTITKLDAWLAILAQHIAPDASMWLNLFSGYMAILDKKLVKIQENTIDVKDSLKNIEDKKHPKPKLSLWTRFLNFVKEMFN
jgi:DNA repair exonuclease SbcCD ATPase subunit